MHYKVAIYIVISIFFYEISSWGYVVVASQYRGNGGMEEIGGKDVNDVLALIPVLDHEMTADMSRIVTYGCGRGSWLHRSLR
jgi:dipeptidyl aminopeptidase/acylaminoacyl peptidase